MKKYYLGFDFGASSGRAILGILDIDEATGKKNLDLEEVYRFPNEAVREGNVLRWETERLFNEMKTGITLVAEKGIHIFNEKPIALNLERGQSMVDAIEKAGVHSQVGYHMRFGKAVRRVRELMETGVAGRPTLFSANYE